MSGSRLRWVLVVVGVLVAAWTSAAIGVRASYGNRTTGDEPHYLITALSLAEDRDLTVGDEIDERAYVPFHEQRLWNQATPLADGRLVEPHDPLLPVLLSAPVAVAGWVGGKLALAAIAGALAASTVWVAVRRFDVGVTPAVVVVGSFSMVMPLTAYANQVYPELPAALAVVLAVGALTGPMRRAGLVSWWVALVALPWLSVKYVPIAAALAVMGALVLWRRGSRRPLVVSLAVLATAGVVYVVAHHLLYGGATVYAAGGHFVEGGQLSVMGYEPNYPGRAVRLLGLLVDRRFGLAAWAPVYLLAVPALAALVRARPPGWTLLVVPLAAGWLNATFVAQTMHGWWSPGRQVVVVVPLVVLAVAWWVGRVRAALTAVAVLAAVGVVNWLWLVVEASTGRRTLVVDFFETANPLYRAWSALLPDGMRTSGVDLVLLGAWCLLVAALAVAGWRSVTAIAARPDTALDVTPRKEPATCAPAHAASLV